MVAFKNTAPVVWLLVAIAVCVSGIILLFDVKLAWEIIEMSISGLVFVVGIMYLISVILKTSENRLKTLGIGLLCVFGGIALFATPQIIKGTFNMVAGALGMLIGFLVLLNGLKLRRDGAAWVGTLFTALLYIVLGFDMLIFANQGRLFGLIFGIYLILFSFNIFGDALVNLMGSNTGVQKIKKHVRVSLPVVFAAFLPIRMLKKVNKLVEEEPNSLLLLSDKTKKKAIDLEIYVHTREGLIPGMGHVDICMGDLVYSYGNYDDATWKMGGFFADGVMVEMDRASHIKQALEVEKKILMVYGLALTPEHKKGAQDKLNEIIKELLPWEPLAEQSEKGEINGKPEEYNDVSSQLYKDTGARFYKFRFGNPFRTYYAMGTNCVKLVDTVVGKTGIDLLRINGIITPGAYLDYLDRLYERGDSIVVTRTLYQDIDEKDVS
ncbi:MAG: MFS transporter [Eubacteriaceae bacterium]|nr:MFS transporter [Eubacteriaceae bacterium]